MSYVRRQASLTVLAAVLAVLMCPLADAAPPVRFERLGLDEGLSQQAVLAIGQDASGFIWLGTEDGLNRYDGFTFQSSGRDGVHMEGLSNAFVTDIQTDAAGALWIATDGGGILAREAHSGRFTGLPPAIAGDAGLDSARTLKFDARGRVWIGTRDAGVAIYDPQRQTIKRFRHDANDTSSLSADAIHSLLIVAGGAWIGTASGLDYLSDDPDSKPRRYALGSSSWRTGGAHAVRAMLEDRAGMLWIATDRGLIRLEPGGGKQTLFQSDAHAPDALPADEVQALLEDSAGRLWVGTSAGLAAYDATKQRFDIYKHDAADPTSLPDDRIVSLFEDRAGLLWVGTQLAGVAKWNPRSWSFGHRRERDAPAMVNHITSFTEDRLGTVWIGTFGAGLHTVDEASGAMRRWPDERDGAGSSGDDAIMALLTDRAGAVWVGTMNGGLRRIAPGRAHTDTYQHDPTNPHSLPADGVMSLLEDSAGRIWIGTYGGGLSRFTPATNDFQPAVAGVPESSPLSGGRVTALAEDAEGRIWAGTDGAGLHMLIPATGETRHWLHDAADADSLSADTIYALHLDASGVLWIGTHGGGVARVRATGESSPLKFSRYDETRGLPDNTVYGILSDDQGRLWLSTGRGLASLEPQTGAVRSFHRGHGLQGEEFNFGAAFRSGAGRLYFGGTNGYNVFTPQLLEFNTHPPAVALTGVSILNQPLQSVSPYERLEQLQLGYRDQVVTFDFAALDFAAPRENRYRYRLEGFDADWVDAGGRRSATYTRLAGGRYTFRVQAANAHSRWSDSGLALPLQVEAPPWKRSWAYAGYVAVVCLCICACWVAWRNKRAREQRYRLLLETKVRDRTREIAERNAELEVANRRLEEASLTDPLTGLANRRALMQALPSLAASCHGERRVPAQAGQIILMIIDLDYFKPINDRYGHEAGDAVLKQVAAILRDCVRSTDLAVRWGGDEFVVVYAAANLSEGGVLAERIRSRIAKHHFQLDHGNTARTSCSIGFVCYPFVSGAPHLLSHEQSLNVADTALLEAKAERNAWIGWGGMPTAHDITGLFKALDSNPALVAERGALQVVSSAYRPDDTVDDLIRHLRAR